MEENSKQLTQEIQRHLKSSEIKTGSSSEDFDDYNLKTEDVEDDINLDSCPYTSSPKMINEIGLKCKAIKEFKVD